MKRSGKTLIITLLLHSFLGLYGCSTPMKMEQTRLSSPSLTDTVHETVQSQVTAKHHPQFATFGSFAIEAANISTLSHPNYPVFRQKLAAQLIQQGFYTSNPLHTADYRVKLSIRLTPNFPESNAQANQVTGQFRRHVRFSIMINKPTQPWQPRHFLYQSTAISIGICHRMAPVYDAILQAMFEQFPLANDHHIIQQSDRSIQCQRDA